jgi:hypothetical protein
MAAKKCVNTYATVFTLQYDMFDAEQCGVLVDVRHYVDTTKQRRHQAGGYDAAARRGKFPRLVATELQTRGKTLTHR